MKSRSSCMHDTDELIDSPSTLRIELWSNYLQYVPHKLMQTHRESLASGASGTWLEWKYLNRPCTKMARRKHNMKKWKYIEDHDTMCECKEADTTMDHLLECPLLKQSCSLNYLIIYKDTRKDCAKHWIGLV